MVKAADGDEALLQVEEEAPDVIVLDWMLPGVSGIEVCRRIKMRSELRRIPVIMLSARSEEVDRVRGLETGADDYVVKPYSVIELMARVRSQLRRARPSTVGERLEFDDIILDSGNPPRDTRRGRSETGSDRVSRCSARSWKNRAGSGAVSNFWTGFGDVTFTWIPARWTSISGACARRSAAMAATIRCARFAAQDTLWADPRGLKQKLSV